MAKKGNDTTLAPSAGEGWDAWGAACGFTSWAQAAGAIGITVAHLVTVRKNAPRKTIRLAMDAVLAAQATQGDAAMRRLAEITDVPSDTLDRLLIGRATEGDQLIAYDAILAAETRAVSGGFLPNGTRVMWQSSSGTEFPATITAYNPATYDAVLDDGCDAKGFSRNRFFKVSTAPSPVEPKVCNRNCDCVGPCKLGDAA